MYIIKNDKSLVGSIYDISMLRRSQTQSGTHQCVRLHTKPLEKNDAVDPMSLSDVNQES